VSIRLNIGGDENHSKDNQFLDLEAGDYLEVGDMARRMNSFGSLAAWSCALLITATVAAEQPADIHIAQMSVGSSGLSWQPAVSYESAVLMVSGPGDLNLRREFAAGEALAFRVNDTNQAGLEDGQYAWELRFSPVIDRGVKEILRAARESGDTSEIEDLKKQGKLPAEPLVASGYFRVVGGSIVAEKKEPPMRRVSSRVDSSGPEGIVDTDSGVATKDQVILDDLIVDGSACIGMDCVNGESFGFDTIRIKENNLRIRAVDTSSTSSFPSRDWQITFNDSANGGANKFSIDDIDGGRTPFTIEAGAPSHSLYVDDGGRLGFGTSTPVVDLHLKTGNTPTLRLEQDGSSGFTPQTWDVAGNEAGFFIRDATNGSTLPFRILPGASSQSLVIAGNDEIGIGAGTDPAAKFHIENTAGDDVDDFVLTSDGDIGIGTTSPTYGLEVHRTVASGENPVVAVFRENGAINFMNAASSAGGFGTWNDFPLALYVNLVERLRLDNDNSLTMASGARCTAGGFWVNNSSRTRKENISSLGASEAIDTLLALTPVTFNYLAEPGEEYVGFIAEDVPDIVATNDHQHMGAMDVVAVLTKVVQEQQKVISELELRLNELEQR
jgi:hypothetical protein